ncbi:MAG: M4 family metallopeptidase [Bacillota bacterium]
MKIRSVLLLLPAVIFLSGSYLSGSYLSGSYLSGGNQIKSKAGVSKFNNTNYDPVKGLQLLESKAGHKLKTEWSSGVSVPAFIGGRLTLPGYSSGRDKAESGIIFLTENTELFGIQKPSEELFATSSFTDELSMTHVKYLQKHNGIRICSSELIIHFNPDGSIESVNGNYLPTIEIDIKPAITSESAIFLAKSGLSGYRPVNEESELVIYLKNNLPVLAYEVRLPSKARPRMRVYINAQSGEIIKKDDGLRYDGAAKGTGVGLDGKSVSLNSFYSGGKYYLIDATLAMFKPPIDSLSGVISTYDAQNDTSEGGYQKTYLVSDPNNDNNFNDNQRLRSAVSAHVYSRTVYEFYRTRFNRNSFDGSGKTITNVVHYLENYNNAFWNGAFLTYGDGDGKAFSNLAGSLDVIAHEITHAVTEHTANLYYELQSGALNESISDVFASLIDSTDWLIGEDIYTPGISGDGLRNMQDPHNGQTYGDIQNGWLPAHMSEFIELENTEEGDWGGVHINCGIPNKAFYNTASVIGHWKSGKIWYRALTAYLASNAQFSDFRIACLNAAKDLFGESSTEYTTVSSAFTSVGIMGSTDPGAVTELKYDDNMPETGVYETDANWQLAVKFTPPVKNCEIQSVKVYYSGDAKNGSGKFTLTMYEAGQVNGLPSKVLINPYAYTPSDIGWYKFSFTGTLAVKDDFYVGILYDGTAQPMIGADLPPGNGRAYEYDPGTSSWSKLLTPNDYTLFMRATVKSATTEVEAETKVPEKFVFEQNYPNPFNPSTSIRYSLPEGRDVKISVYDITGKEVARLADNYQNPGTYIISWNGKDDSGRNVSSGIYYCRIKAGEFLRTIKMSLIK